jgi:hypothetical protein
MEHVQVICNGPDSKSGHLGIKFRYLKNKQLQQMGPICVDVEEAQKQATPIDGTHLCCRLRRHVAPVLPSRSGTDSVEEWAHLPTTRHLPRGGVMRRLGRRAAAAMVEKLIPCWTSPTRWHEDLREMGGGSHGGAARPLLIFQPSTVQQLPRRSLGLRP